MTAHPLQPQRLLTVDEYAALPEDSDVRHELREGRLIMSPPAIPEHGFSMLELGSQLRDQVPGHVRVAVEAGIDLGLVPANRPGFVRIPDLAVVTRDGVDRRRREGGLLRACEVVLAVEIISDGSRRIDRSVKHGEYADAGIPHYWIIDLDGRPSLTACHHAGEFGYADAPPVTGTFTISEPFPIRLDLDRLA